jgi:hypothetical protein
MCAATTLRSRSLLEKSHQASETYATGYCAARGQAGVVGRKLLAIAPNCQASAATGLQCCYSMTTQM